MDGSATAIWIIVAVAVAGLAVWLGSVAPRRDEPVTPGEVSGETPFIQARKTPPARNPQAAGQAWGARPTSNPARPVTT